MQKDMLQVGVPDAEALKAGPGSRFDPVFEIDPADLGLTGEDPGSRPVKAHQFHGLVHSSPFIA